MNILLLEDTTKKAQRVREHLQRYHHNVTSCFCTDDARRDLKTNKYDALIVDLKVPKVNDTPPKVSYGITLIQAIFDSVREVFFRPKIVIVLSRYLDDSVKSSLQTYPICMIPYTMDEAWKTPLINRLNYYDRRRCDIAIITAVDVEFEAVKQWGWQDGSDIPHFTYYSKEITNSEGKVLKAVLVKLKDMGMVCATNMTDRIIHYFEPKCIIMTGICAGRKGAVSLGDLVVASQAWDYGSGSIEEISKPRNVKDIVFCPAPDYISMKANPTNVFDWYTPEKIRILKDEVLRGAQESLNVKLLEIALEEQKRVTKVYQKAMATGAAVIKAEQFTNKFIKEHNRKYMGIDMETYGVYYAAEHGGVKEFFAVKAVSDLADTQKNDEFQSYCAKLSAAFALHFITNRYIG